MGELQGWGHRSAAEIDGDRAFYDAAEKAITFVARTQHLTASHPEIRGAVAGSFPIYGGYERFKYPNWAAKFFVDALLALNKVKNGGPPSFFGG